MYLLVLFMALILTGVDFGAAGLISHYVGTDFWHTFMLLMSFGLNSLFVRVGILSLKQGVS